MILTRPLAALLLLAATASGASAQTSLTPQQRAEASALRDACAADHARFCADVRPGGGRILQCFQAHAADLSPACRTALSSAADLRKAAAGTPAK